jgi:hypothetical protein
MTELQMGWECSTLAGCWRKAIVEKLVKKFSPLEPEGSLSCSQQSATVPYPEPVLIQTTPSHPNFLR